MSSPLAAAPRARTPRTPLGVLVSPGANLLGSVLRPSGDSASQQIKTATQLGEGPEMPTPRYWGRNENFLHPMVFLLGLVLVFKIKGIISIRISSKILDFCRLKGPITDKSVLLVKDRGALERASACPTAESQGRLSASSSTPAAGGRGRPGPRWPRPAGQCYFREELGGGGAHTPLC